MAKSEDPRQAAMVKVTEIDPGAADEALQRGVIFIDVREPSELSTGMISGAVPVNPDDLEARLQALVPNKTAAIVLYCATGARSASAALTLQAAGYNRVSSLVGGFEAWKTAGHRWSNPGPLSDTKLARYSRHLLLDEIGVQGQQKLLEAKILIVGAGGLGSPAALYLAAAGVGTIGIADMDQVDVSNLQRQILHNSDAVGKNKVDSAAKTLGALNPDVKVVKHGERLEAYNIINIMSEYDLVVDGSDNFPTRYLLNDASVKLGIPIVHGSVYRFEGQVTVFEPVTGPTYRDLLAEPPAPELAPNCAEAGVLGVLCGVIGSIQALEAIKLILRLGDSLVGRLVVFDALDMSFSEFRIDRDPENPVTYSSRETVDIS